MAKDKKSFILYADLINVVSKLPKEKAGELFIHILQYVNDLNPETEDLIINIAFEPIKMQLKRDLKKWELSTEQRRQAGIKSAESRLRKSNEIERALTTVENRSTDSTVNVNVNVNDTVNVNEEKYIFDFKTELLKLGIEKQIVSDWLKVRSKKKAANTETAFKGLVYQINKSGLTANDCIKKAVEKSWIGFEAEWINNKTPKNNQQQWTEKAPRAI